MVMSAAASFTSTRWITNSTCAAAMLGARTRTATRKGSNRERVRSGPVRVISHLLASPGNGLPGARKREASLRRPTRARKGRRGCFSLRVQHLHGGFGVALAGGGAGREQTVDLRELVPRQRDAHRAQVVLEVLHALGARNGHDVLPLGQDPRQRELRGSAALPCREALDVGGQLQVLLERRPLEARVGVPPVVAR